MGDNAHQADLLSGPARSPRTGLDPAAQREGIERSPGSAVAAGELMRLFVAIAPPPTVLDEPAALVEPLRARRLDLRWTNREAWHVTLAFLGQVDEAAAARLVPRLQRAAGRHHQVRLPLPGAGGVPPAAPGPAEWGAAREDYQGQPWTAARVHLVRSRLGAAGPPRYTSLANWPLRTPP